ncbi:hypothetical protein ACEWY4_021309 [Coilia grayii]|uniref:C-type lectin domain-containing protein n=1 Tax=Coilia grayii TaxID=363190 RepID=A0ABD1J9Y6_9TELE
MFKLMLVMTLGIARLPGSGAEADVALGHCSGNHSNWFKVGEHCAQHFQEKVTYEQAMKNCRAKCEECRLISIHDAVANAAVTSLTGGQLAWIGAIRFEGQYIWTDGSAWDYQNWAPGEPLPAGTCVYINFQSAGKWDNFHCDRTYGYICGFCNPDLVLDRGQITSTDEPKYSMIQPPLGDTTPERKEVYQRPETVMTS